MGSYGGMILTGKTKELGKKNFSQYHFVHHNPIWTDPDVKPGFRGERLATNRLSHCTAYVVTGETLSSH
jgi:hypothetical protein